jgi:hypothetical protein
MAPHRGIVKAIFTIDAAGRQYEKSASKQKTKNVTAGNINEQSRPSRDYPAETAITSCRSRGGC